MIYDLYLTWRNIRSKPVQTMIPMLIVALAIGLSTAVLALGNGVRQGVVQSADPFGVVVVGPDGSPQQLVLNTILLQDDPLGVIPYQVYEDLSEEDFVRYAVPLAKGDNIGGQPIIGTNENFFRLSINDAAGSAFQIAEGRSFEQPFEVVLGSIAAERLGLPIGGRFEASHGVRATINEDVHEGFVYEVVGILGASGTPYDTAVFTPVESVWQSHGVPMEGMNTESSDGTVNAGSAQPPSAGDLYGLDIDLGSDSLTSIMVVPTTPGAEVWQIWQQFYNAADAQAAIPGQELGGLFDLLSQAEDVLSSIGYLVLVIAALTLFLSIYSVTVNRRREIAIMRSVGSSRTNIFRMVLFEALIITLLGALLGRFIGYGAAAVIAAGITQESAIPIPIVFLADLEPLLWGLTVMVGIVAGMVPAAMAYSVDVIENLFAS